MIISIELVGCLFYVFNIFFSLRLFDCVQVFCIIYKLFLFLGYYVVVFSAFLFVNMTKTKWKTCFFLQKIIKNKKKEFPFILLSTFIPFFSFSLSHVFFFCKFCMTQPTWLVAWLCSRGRVLFSRKWSNIKKIYKFCIFQHCMWLE